MLRLKMNSIKCRSSAWCHRGGCIEGLEFVGPLPVSLSLLSLGLLDLSFNNFIRLNQLHRMVSAKEEEEENDGSEEKKNKNKTWNATARNHLWRWQMVIEGSAEKTTRRTSVEWPMIIRFILHLKIMIHCEPLKNHDNKFFFINKY